LEKVGEKFGGGIFNFLKDREEKTRRLRTYTHKEKLRTVGKEVKG